MQYSTTMRAVVMQRANAEAKFRKQSKAGVEDYFLGILKLCELKAEDFLKAPAIILRVTNTEIKALNILFKDIYKVDTGQLRSLLRGQLAIGGMAETVHVDEYLSRADEIAKARKSDEIFPTDLLNAILEKPTMVLKQVCGSVGWILNTEDEEDIGDCGGV